MNKTEKISFRIDADDCARLEVAALKERLPLATYVRKVLAQHLDGREDSTDMQRILNQQETRS